MYKRQARDGELEAILEELKKPVYLEDEVLGRFTLDRQVNWFEADVDWLGQTVRLSFDLSLIHISPSPWVMGTDIPAAFRPGEACSYADGGRRSWGGSAWTSSWWM